MKQEVRDRRSDEVEAMQAYYGNALSSSIPLVSSKKDNEIPLEGPWFIRIIDIDDDTADNTRRKRRPRGNSMPARLFHSMSHLGGWSSGTADRNNATTNDKIREEHLEASLLPELEREMKRLSSRSRERNKHTSLQAILTMLLPDHHHRY